MSTTLGTGPTGEMLSGADGIEASRVNGTKVYNTEGEGLGHIHDVVIGKRDGKVRYAIMSFGGFLGIGEEYHPLPWNVLKYDERQGGYVVGLTADQLRDAPHYRDADRPSWTDEAYGRRVHDYYGVGYY